VIKVKPEVKPGCDGVVSTINSGNGEERSLYLSRRLPQVRDCFEFDSILDSIRWRTYGHTPPVQAFQKVSSATKPAWKLVWIRFEDDVEAGFRVGFRASL
jgi:hypothetical protein